MKKTIDVSGLSKGGPYSHAVQSGNLIFLSGQVGLNRENEEDFQSQFRVAMGNIGKIAEEAGRSLSDVVKISVYLSDARLFQEMNTIFSEYFKEDPPARTTLVAGFMNPKIMVEIDVILAA